MPQITWRWFLSSLIPPDLQHKIRALEIDLSIPLDGDLAKCLHLRHTHQPQGILPDDFSCHINIFNAVYDDRGTPSGQPDPQWNGNARHEVRILDDCHYAVQVAIPWGEIGVEPVEGRTVIGIEFGVNGKDPETGV